MGMECMYMLSSKPGYNILNVNCRPEMMKSRVLELNASDERGIQVSAVCGI